MQNHQKYMCVICGFVYDEAKGTGFDSRVMRKIVSLRKTNLEKRREEQELLDLYMAAIGMVE